MIEFWHNPRCSKSRQALALLQEANAPLTLRRYLEEVPTLAELKAAHAALGSPKPIEMMRKGEKRFRELGLSNDSPDETLFSAMADNPILIERPLAIRGNKAVIGRPPETVLTLLD